MSNPITKFIRLALSGVAGSMIWSSQALAEALKPYQIWHQEAASPGQAAIEWFDLYTFYFIVPITLFVTVLLAYVMFRFREKANPVPSTVTHNTAIEVVWTLAPVAILVAISIPSFQLLTAQFNPPKEPTVTIKATGHQWYWEFEYQDDVEITFETRPIGVDEIAGSKEKAEEERVALGKTDLKLYPRLLAVDNELVVPVGEVVRLLVTAAPDGVIHNFAMPAFGMKMDGIPGRINETYFQPTKIGLYYGQCSELCGKYHAYMPLAVRVVSEDDFEVWSDMAGDDVDAANKALQASIDARTKKIDVASN